MDRPLSSSEKKEYAKNTPRKRKGEGIRISYRFLVTLVLCFIFAALFSMLNDQPPRTDLSNYESRGLAPAPADFKDPIIQVYAARTWGLKGNVAVHTWLAYKEYAANSYQIIQVIGWRQQGDGNVLFAEDDTADKTWWGNEPMLLLDVRGTDAQPLIPKLKSAIEAYPWSNEYVLFPGPNSNTFVSWIGQQVPELKLDLPATAIGKDWRPLNESFRDSPSGTGKTLSLIGLLGIQIGMEEGIEINVLGLHLEVDPLDQQVSLPFFGTVSMWWIFLFIGLRFSLVFVLKRYELTYLRLNHHFTDDF